MKKFTLVLLMLLLVVACGPATPREDNAVEGDDSADTAVPTVVIEGGEAVTDAAPPSRPIPEYDEADLITTESGLQYVILEEGDGEIAQTGDTMLTDYTGWLTDGTMFDSSIDRGTPFPVSVGTGSVIDGWDEALSILPEGTRALLIIPPDIAYGANGSGTIPPDSTLIFEVDLIEMQPIQRPTEVAESDYIETESGLKYYDIEEGSGALPADRDEVVVEFVGWFDNGGLLGSSADNGAPLVFQLGADQMFPGLEEGVSTMNVGGKRQLIIPAALAEGIGGIAPDGFLTFEVELVEAREVPPPTAVDEADYTVLESGVKIYDIEEGTGATPQEGDLVNLEYVLWLADGSKIDSSESRGTPLSFPFGVGQMPLLALEEGIADMKAGGTRQIVIPAEQGAQAGLPADQDTIFEVYLVPPE
ncbi:MAG: FKBP-type peptidyl-prolyl cis-trans isomerase [Anaerolineae bacterium]|nr:FKBP-type peptidyl-prolyl cis-trans isomerase [Anaerolineae bacterium]